MGEGINETTKGLETCSGGVEEVVEHCATALDDFALFAQEVFPDIVEEKGPIPEEGSPEAAVEFLKENRGDVYRCIDAMAMIVDLAGQGDTNDTNDSIRNRLGRNGCCEIIEEVLSRHSFYDVQLAKLGMLAIKLMARNESCVDIFSRTGAYDQAVYVLRKYSVTNGIVAYMQAAILAIEALCNLTRKARNDNPDLCHREMLAMGDGLDVRMTQPGTMLVLRLCENEACREKFLVQTIVGKKSIVKVLKAIISLHGHRNDDSSAKFARESLNSLLGRVSDDTLV